MAFPDTTMKIVNQLLLLEERKVKCADNGKICSSMDKEMENYLIYEIGIGLSCSVKFQESNST